MGKIIKSLVLVAIFCLISEAAILPSSNIQTPPVILNSKLDYLEILKQK